MSDFDYQTATPKQVVAERDRIKNRRKDLDEEERIVLEQSTEQRLEKIRRERLDLINQSPAVARAENRLIAMSKPSPVELEMKNRVKELVRLEHSQGFGIVVMPAKFISANAVKDLQTSIADREIKIRKLMAPFEKSPGVTPGPRIVSEVNRLNEEIAELEKSHRYAEAGEEIFKLRAERIKLAQKVTELARKRREKSLAA